MIRHVTEFTPEPRFLLICDVLSCSNIAVRPVSMPVPDVPLDGDSLTRVSHAPDPFQSFVQAAIQAGWTINAFHHICPQHTQKFAGEQSRIVVPNQVTLQ